MSLRLEKETYYRHRDSLLIAIALCWCHHWVAPLNLVNMIISQIKASETIGSTPEEVKFVTYGKVVQHCQSDKPDDSEMLDEGTLKIGMSGIFRSYGSLSPFGLPRIGLGWPHLLSLTGSSIHNQAGHSTHCCRRIGDHSSNN